MKNTLFVTDLSSKSCKAFSNTFQLAEELSFNLKVVHFQEAENLEIIFDTQEVQDKINQFVKNALGFLPEDLPIGMGLNGSLVELVEEMGLFFDLIIIPKGLNPEFKEYCLFPNGKLDMKCPVLFVPPNNDFIGINKIMYLGAQFGELDYSVQRQLRNFCRRTKSSLQFAKPLRKRSWFFNKTPFYKSKFMVELGWFGDLFFSNLKKYFQKEKIDVLILSATGVGNFWLNKKGLLNQISKFEKPVLVLPQKVSNRAQKPKLETAA